jgi:hypothetical protein
VAKGGFLTLKHNLWQKSKICDKEWNLNKKRWNLLYMVEFIVCGEIYDKEWNFNAVKFIVWWSL